MAKAKTQAQLDMCWCRAYPFPHGYGSGKCKRRSPLKGTAINKRRMEKRNKRARREGEYTPNR